MSRFTVASFEAGDILLDTLQALHTVTSAETFYASELARLGAHTRSNLTRVQEVEQQVVYGQQCDTKLIAAGLRRQTDAFIDRYVGRRVLIVPKNNDKGVQVRRTDIGLQLSSGPEYEHIIGTLNKDAFRGGYQILRVGILPALHWLIETNEFAEIQVIDPDSRQPTVDLAIAD